MKRITRRKFLSGSMAAAASLTACGRRSNDDREPASPGRLIASRDHVAVDARALTLGRFGGREMTVADVPHIRLAAEMGLGKADSAQWELKKVEI